MLARAQQVVHTNELENVVLEIMDAEDMSFPDSFFDKVACMYVASVTPNPGKMIAEIKRVCKPGGDIFILNHFSNDNPVVRTVEKTFLPLAEILGFRPSFSLEQFITNNRLDVVERFQTNLFGYWTLIHAVNNGELTTAEKVSAVRHAPAFK